MRPLPTQHAPFPSQDKFLLATKGGPTAPSTATSPCSEHTVHTDQHQEKTWVVEDREKGRGPTTLTEHLCAWCLYNVYTTSFHSQLFMKYPRPVSLKQGKERRHKLQHIRITRQAFSNTSFLPALQPESYISCAVEE